MAMVTRRDRFAPAPGSTDHPDGRAWDQRWPADHRARRALAPLFAGYGPTGSPAQPPGPPAARRPVRTPPGTAVPGPGVTRRPRRRAPRWLLGGATPARSCWYAWRDRGAAVLDTLNRQVLAGAQAPEVTTGRRGALDGTSVAAA